MCVVAENCGVGQLKTVVAKCAQAMIHSSVECLSRGDSY